MTPEFVEALGLWESGELSRDELARRFPDEDVAGLLDAFDGMSAASAGPAPDAAIAWAAVRTRLPARLAHRRRGRGKAIRLLAAALIAVLVLGASAYAVVPGVRRAVNDAAGAITHDDDDLSGAAHPAEDAGHVDEPAPDVSDDVGSITDRDEGPGGQNGSEADEDAEEHSKDGSGSDSNDDATEDGSGSGTDDGSRSEGSLEGGSGSGEEADGDSAEGDGNTSSEGSDG